MAFQEKEPIAALIREWRRDLALMNNERSRIRMLCFAWNWATAPARLTTDRESRALARFARACRRKLAGRPGWHMSENGRLWC